MGDLPIAGSPISSGPETNLAVFAVFNFTLYITQSISFYIEK